MNSGIPEATSNNNSVIKAARLSQPSACVCVWVPRGLRQPSKESQGVVNGEENANLWTKSLLLKKKPWPTFYNLDALLMCPFIWQE